MGDKVLMMGPGTPSIIWDLDVHLTDCRRHTVLDLRILLVVFVFVSESSDTRLGGLGPRHFYGCKSGPQAYSSAVLMRQGQPSKLVLQSNLK